MISIISVMVLVACLVMEQMELNERAMRKADGWEG